jgi:hypothetical protein
MSCGWRLKLGALAAMFMVCSSARTGAQTATAPELKAAFLYNFAKFTEWPPDVLPPGTPLVLCVASDSHVHEALEAITRGRDVEGHPVVVRKVDAREEFQSCHLLYVDDLNTKRAGQLVERLKGAPVLSVSDFQRFAQLGGSAHLFVEDGRMRFAVNLEATQRTKLRLSSRLLSLAQIVKDDPNAFQP